MNKRQKKKAFKKKYGFNPTPAGIENAAEAIRKLAEKINDLIPILCDAVSDAINGLLETIPEVLTAAVKIINENMDKSTEIYLLKSRELKNEAKDDTSN